MPTYTKKVYQALFGHSPNTGLLPTGGADVAVESDGSDATYGREAASGLPADYGIQGGNLGRAAGERIVSLAQYIRSKSPGAGAATINLGCWSGSTFTIAEGVQLTLPLASSVIQTLAIAPQSGQLLNPYTGLEWGDPGVGGLLPSLTFRDASAPANAAYIYEAGIYIYTLKAATITAPSAPSGTITATQYPNMTASVSAIVESWQMPVEFLTRCRVEFSVYRYCDVGAAAAPPAGTYPLWVLQMPVVIDTYIDGVTPTVAPVTVQCPTPFANDTYVLYVRAVRDHPSGVDVWTGYQRSQWIQNFPAPAAPTAGAVVDNANQRIALSATGAALAGYDSTTAYMDVQRQVGSSWRAVRGMTALPVAVGSLVALGNDLECDRGVTNTYRVRFSMTYTSSGVVGTSPWTTVTCAGPTTLGTGWNFKAVNLPATSWLGAGILTEPSESDQTQSTIFYPLDRPNPVVVKGTSGGNSGSYDFIARGVAECALVQALIDYEGLILLETAFGDVRYVSMTGATWKRQGTTAFPRLAGTIATTQVDCDLAVSSV